MRVSAIEEAVSSIRCQLKHILEQSFFILVCRISAATLHFWSSATFLAFLRSEELISTGSARVFVYSVFRGVLNRVYGILQLKYGYSVYHFL